MPNLPSNDEITRFDGTLNTVPYINYTFTAVICILVGPRVGNASYLARYKEKKYIK
jgi:hypothetical protein